MSFSETDALLGEDSEKPDPNGPFFEDRTGYTFLYYTFGGTIYKLEYGDDSWTEITTDSGTGPTTYTWDTATTLDAFQTQTGVAHEAVTYTDHADAGVVQQGYSHSNPFESSNLRRDYPLAESSGAAHDVWGNNDAINTSVAGYDVDGPVGETAMDFAGSHYIDLPEFATPSGYTFSMWANFNAVADGTQDPLIRTNQNFVVYIREKGGAIEWWHHTGDGYTQIGAEPVNNNEWVFAGQTWDGSTARAWFNGSVVATASVSTLGKGGANPDYDTLGYEQPGGTYLDGQMAQFRYRDVPVDLSVPYETSLTGSYTASKRQLETTGDGSVELATTAAIPTTETVEITVFEDSNGDGTADNSVTQTIDDGANTYTLSGFDTSSGNYVWWAGNWNPANGGNLLDAAEVDSVELTA